MSRALLTDAERDAIQGAIDDPNKTSTYLSRVRGRIDQLDDDITLIQRHRPELYEQIHDVVCEPSRDDRIEQLENRVQELETRLNDTDHAE
ncbi:hypothetical protein [Halobaculum sp. D14]|uniref:hypothetical protein n=1 Tax=Halobaculum sp. D14 TaxID=3421642 RepID=UPI003EBE4A90